MKIQKLTYQFFSRKKTKESKARRPMTSDIQALNNKVANKLIPVKPTLRHKIREKIKSIISFPSHKRLCRMEY
jgi:hypothetical protein